MVGDTVQLRLSENFRYDFSPYSFEVTSYRYDCPRLLSDRSL